MKRDRMKFLIEGLEAVERADLEQDHSHFDIGAWLEEGGTIVEGEVRATCGTVACALGWLAMTKRANADGLRLLGNGMGVVPTYCGHENYEAGAAYLGISYEEARYLFSPVEYGYKAVAPRDVIERVKALLGEYR